MAGKQDIKNQLEEELLEAASFYANFAEDMGKIIELIDTNEAADHENDKTRNEVTSFLLKALESYSAKNYEDVDRFVHSAIQRLHSQELIDLKDDKPRTDAKIKLAIVRQKAIYNQEALIKLIAKYQEIK